MGGRTGAGKDDGRRKRRPGLEEQKRIIVEAAVGLFVERGSRGVSISEICAAADVSRHTYYRCFDDKSDLLAYVYEQVANQYVEQIIFSDLPKGGAVDAWMTDAIDEVVDAVFEEAAMAQFIFVEYGDPTSPAYRVISDVFDRSAERLQAWLSRHYRVRASRLFLKSIMASVQWILLETMRAGLTDKSRREAKEAAWQVASSAFASLRKAQR